MGCLSYGSNSDGVAAKLRQPGGYRRHERHKYQSGQPGKEEIDQCGFQHFFKGSSYNAGREIEQRCNGRGDIAHTQVHSQDGSKMDGLKPSSFIIGTKIGVARSVPLVSSMSMPRTIINRFIITSIPQRFSVTE